MKTSIPDISSFAGAAWAVVHDGWEDSPWLIITPRRVEPLFEQLQGTVITNRTTALMGPFEESQKTLARLDYQVFMPDIGLIAFLLLWADQDRFGTLLQAFVDTSKLPQVLHFWSTSRCLIMIMCRSRCHL